MPLPDVVVNRSSPVPLYFQVAEQIERRHPRRPPRPRRPDRQRGGPRRPARALPPDHAPGHPDARRQGHAGPQARGRHPGRATPRSGARSSSPACTTTSPAAGSSRRRPSSGCELVHADERAPAAAERVGEPSGLAPRPAPRRQGRAARADVQPRARVASPTSSGSTSTTPASTSTSAPQAINLRVAHQVIGARTVDSREAQLLGGRKGDPVLTMERTSYDDQGRAVEYGLHLYRPDRYAYETTLVDR